MPKIQDLYTALEQAVHDEIGRACHYQFASTWTLAGPPKLREATKQGCCCVQARG